jgi:Regulatory CLIP domain of proteinases
MDQLSIGPVSFGALVTNFHSIPPLALVFRIYSNLWKLVAYFYPFFPSWFLGTCNTPANESGTCISIKQCPHLLQMLKVKPLTEQQKQFLHNSQCGFIDNVAYVCCATPKPVVVHQQGPTDGVKLLPDLTICGGSTSDRIVGGERTKIDEFPWMALIQYVNGGCYHDFIFKRHNFV